LTLNKKYTLASAVALSVVIAGFSSPVFNTITNAPSVVYAEDILDQEQPKNDSPEAVKDDNSPVSKKGQRVAGKIKEKIISSDVLPEKESWAYPQAVINGGSDLKQLDVNKPVNNAAVIMQTRKGGMVLSGSGMFVSPNVYVTVAHNFLNDQGETGNIASVDYWVGSNSERQIRPTSGISKPISLSKVHFFNQKAYGNPPAGTKKAYYDLAVVVVDEPLMFTQPGYDFNDLVKSPQVMSDGTPVKIIGYPGNLTGITAPVKKGQLYEQSSNNVVRDTLMPHSNFYLIPNTTVAGMSGSGVLNANNQVMGVHQFGYSDRVGLNGGLIFDQAQLDFINKVVQDNKIQGWKEQGGKKYYFQENGHLAKSTEKNIDGRRWKFDQNGVATDIGVAKEEKPAEKPVENKPAENKPAENKPAENKPAENKPAENKPVENKPVENKPAENKPAENKPAENKPAENKPAENKPAENKPAENKPAENKPAENKPAENKPVNTNPIKPSEVKPSETKPAETKPSDTPSEKKDTPSSTDKGNVVTGTTTEKPSEKDKGDVTTVTGTDKGDKAATTKAENPSTVTADTKTPTVKDPIKTGAFAGVSLLPLAGVAGGLGVTGLAYLSKKRKK
jgi:V8-like Glu-specific endopeptidase